MAKKAARKRPTPAPAQAASGKGRPSTKQASFIVTGDDLIATVENQKREAEDRQALRAMGIGGYVSEFFLQKKSFADIIILDEALKFGAGMWEHKVWTGLSKRPKQIGCAKSMVGMSCALCEAGDFSSFITKLTILELVEWTHPETGEVHTHSKRILPINWRALENFQRYEKGAIKKFGTMRGLQLRLARGSGDTSLRIGEITPNDDGEFYDFWTEEDLVGTYGHPARIGRDGKTILAPEDFDITPYPYADMFLPPKAEELESLARVMVAKAQQEEQEEDAPTQRSAQRKRPSRTAPAHTATEPEFEEAEEEEAEEEETEAAGDETWEAYGAALDEMGEGTPEEQEASPAMVDACLEADVDYNSYGSWAEAGAALDEFLAGSEEEEAEEETEEEEAGEEEEATEPLWAEKGAEADADSESEYIAEFDGIAEQLGLDYNDFGTWEAFGAACDEALEETEAPIAPTAKKKAAAKRTASSSRPNPFA